jgi:hypothetical protein
MAATRVFVSHSSPSEAAKTRLKSVCGKLEAAGYRVFVDHAEITSGDLWRERLHAGLAECQAGLILFDQPALASPWVLKEATILTWRMSLEKGEFAVVPVRLPGVELSDLQARRFEPLLLGEVQQVASDDPDEIVQAFTAKVPPGSQALSLFDLLVRDMARMLTALDVSDASLEEVCRRRVPSIQFTQGESRREKFADVLARELFRVGPPCLAEAVSMLDLLGSAVSRETARRLLELIGPLWVDAEAATLMPRAFQRSSGFQDLALYCTKPRRMHSFIVSDFIRRAYPRSSLWVLFRVDEAHSGDAAGYYIQRIREDVREKYPEQVFDMDDDELDEFINSIVAADPAFVLLPEVPDEDTLLQLRNRYGRLSFVMYTGDHGEAKPPLWKGACYVEPELTSDIERIVESGRTRSQTYLNNLR